MIDHSTIQELCQRIVQEFSPERIILFGSYAYGTPREDSDVDLMVVMAFEGNGLTQSATILKCVKPSFAVDILTKTPEELKQRLDYGDHFLRDVFNWGTVLYASTDH